MIQNKYRIENVFCWSFFIGIVILLFWKCKYGYATLDEAFYPTIGYRFLQGDAILYEEWSNTQLTGILMLPFLKLYQIVNGGMDGVYLYIRYTYTILKIFITVLIYYRLRRFGRKNAYVASMFFLIFAAYGMMVLSYNTFAFGGSLAAIVLLLDNKDSKQANILAMLAGVAFSVSVLGIPYMIVIYGVYCVAIVVKTIFFRKIHLDAYLKHLLSWKTFGYVTLGGAICGTGVLAYICIQSGLKNVIRTIPYILYGDPAHPSKSIYQMTLSYFVRILIGNHRNYWIFIGYMLLAFVLLVYCMDKKRSQRLRNYKLLAAIDSLVLLIIYIVTDNYINSIVFVPNVLAFVYAIFSRNNNTKSIFYCVWIPGMIVSYCEYLASNTGFSGISAASCVATIGSIIIICVEAERTGENTSSLVKITRAFLIITFLFLLYYRSTYVFWEDGGLQSLTDEIEQGTARGLYVTKQTKNIYDQMYEDTEEIRRMSKDTIVLYQADHTLWMSGLQRCGSYSPLNYSLSVDPTILYNYYEEHPDKIADVMYISDTNEKLVDILATEYGYKVDKKTVGTLLWRERR